MGSTLLNKLLYLFNYSWVCYWMTDSQDTKTLSLHNSLQSFNEELKNLINDYVFISKSSISTEIPLTVSITQLPSGDLNQELSNLLDQLKYEIDQVSDESLNEWKGKTTSFLSNYLFMFNIKDKTFDKFQNKDNELVKKLKSLFKTQKEFLSVFNDYLKGRKLPTEIEEFFKSNESDLLDLQDSMYKVNTKLFSIRESVMNSDEDSKTYYNDLVKFFDLFY